MGFSIQMHQKNCTTWTSILMFFLFTHVTLHPSPLSVKTRKLSRRDESPNRLHKSKLHNRMIHSEIVWRIYRTGHTSASSTIHNIASKQNNNLINVTFSPSTISIECRDMVWHSHHFAAIIHPFNARIFHEGWQSSFITGAVSLFIFFCSSPFGWQT